ncbi:MAG: RES domain-containing protein [Thauera sp.]|nr:RES domain-containing protein [Thauera sp.]
MRIFRIADQRHPIWDGTGAALLGGRWNSPGRPAIYGSLSSACAMLEILAHSGIGRIPETQQIVIAEVPDEDALIEWLEPASLPEGWDAEDSGVARQLGDDWLASRRSLVLMVPSVVARLEFNAVVNPAHPDFPRMRVSAPEAVVWDRRLFG